MSTKVVRGIKWTAIERISNQLIQFIVSIVIARMLYPEEYGILAIILVFINISQVFIDSGLGSSLIYYNRLERDDLDTTFYFNGFVSAFLFLIIYSCAPLAERFYGVHELSFYLRVASVVLFSNALLVVPTAILKIRLDFKPLAVSNLIANIISAVLGISLAYYGFGVWALIGQFLSKSVILAILLFLQCHWLPTLNYSGKSLKKLYKYGVNIFATSIVTKFTDEGIATLIAKYLTPYNLGLYSRSGQFASFPLSSIGSLVTTVTFPALSSAKDDSIRYNHLFEGALQIQAFLVIPLYIWLIVVAKPLIVLILTDKWLDAVPVFQILCAGRILALLALTTEQSLNAKGRSDLCFKQQIAKLLFKVVIVFGALPFGIIAVATADAVQTIAAFFITNAVAGKTTGYKISVQLRMISPYLISSVVAGAIAYMVSILLSSELMQLIIAILIGVAVYVCMIFYVFRQRSVISLIKKLV